jgi:hypothetical protein
MVKVCVFQTDNRPDLHFVKLTRDINQLFCTQLGYDYLFLPFDNSQFGNINPCTKKIHIINDFFLKNTGYDILVFLDSDAWIQNGNWLNDIIDNLNNNEDKHGCFSRDPYIKKNTFINSGSFIIKINEFTKNMYQQLLNDLNNDDSHINNWPYDQYYIGNYVFENKDKFTVFIPHTLNTPYGEVLRHNWFKNKAMFNDVYKLFHEFEQGTLLENKESFHEDTYLDHEDFPNIPEQGYEYYKAE